jgi:hypothetical protein
MKNTGAPLVAFAHWVEHRVKSATADETTPTS